MVKLRLKRFGRKKRPFYRIVAAPITAPCDGQVLEELGIYDPLKAKVNIDEEAALRWLNRGAQMTGIVQALFKHQGLLARWKGLAVTVREDVLLKDKPARRRKLAQTSQQQEKAPEPAAPAQPAASLAQTSQQQEKAPEPAAPAQPAASGEEAAASAPPAAPA